MRGGALARVERGRRLEGVVICSVFVESNVVEVEVVEVVEIMEKRRVEGA